MPQYLDEAAITGKAAESSAVPEGRRTLDESEITGQAQPERNIFQRIGDFVSDSGEQKKFAGTVGKVGLAAADMILGIPGQAVGVGANLGARGRALLSGESRKTQEAAGAEAQTLVPEWMVTPLQSIAKSLGMQEPLDQSIVEHILTTAGDKVEKYTRGALSTQDTKDLFNTVMLAGGAKGVDAGLKMALAPKAKGSSAAEARATYAEDAPVKSVATILRPEPVTIESPGQVKALFDVAKKNRPPEISDVAAVETLFAKARSKGLAQIGPKSPYEAIAESKSRIAEGKLLEESPKVEGEPLALPPELAPLNVALEKVKAGRAFDLTAEEKISLDHSVKIRDGQILDHNGRPFERGAVDPELLAKISAGTAAGAYLLSSDNAEQGLAAMGLGLAMSMKGAPEAALLAAAREGGPKAQAAFTELYRQNVKQAERTLQSKFGRQNVDIEGALQDGMTAALAAVATGAFRGESKFSTYLHQAVVNKALNQLEAQRVRPDTVSLTEDPATGRSGLAETLGHNETPANIALNKGLGQQIEAAMAKIDPRFREAFLAIEADGMSYEAAAEKFGVPVGTIRSRVSRAKEALQGYLREYRDGEVGFDEAIPNRATGALGSREGGAADPKLLAALGVGGTTGLWLDRDNPLRGAALGALAGLGTRHAIFKQALDGLDLALGRGSTRVGHIDPQLRRGVRDMEHAASVEMSAASEKIHTFVEEAKKLSPERRASLERAYLDSNVQGVAEAIKGNPALVEGYRQVRQFIDEIGDQLRGFERFGHGMTEHLPRVVKDYEGLIQKLGHEMRTTLEKVMLRAEADMLKRRGRQLSEVERSVILNNFMLKDPATSHLPGFAKTRTIKMTDELRPFYHTMEESLIRYAHAAVEDVATARFFGKDLRTTKDGGKKFTNVDASIGALTDRAMQEGRMTPEQAVEVQAILRARFGQGERAPSGALQDVRNITGLATLGQLGSGIVQTSEALLSAYHHGIKPAVEAAGILLTRRGIKPGEFGLANHLIEETISKRSTGVALSAVLKANLLATFDQLGMKQNLTASYLKNKYLSETAAGRAKLAEKWGEAYGEDFPALVKELQQSTMGRRGPLVDSLLYGELSDIRPSSRFEMPQLYNEHPNGRFMWQLKQFMLTQADVLRRDAYDNIRTGEPAKVAKGLKNLTLYAAALATATIPADAIKDWISGRPFDFTKIDYVENMARNFGLSRYSLDKVQRSPNPAKATLDVAKDMVKPPLVSVGDRVATGFNEPKKLTPMVPLVGRPVYDRYLGGNEAAKIADMKAAKLRIRSEAEARDPGLKAARLLRERERKDRALRAARELR